MDEEDEPTFTLTLKMYGLVQPEQIILIMFEPTPSEQFTNIHNNFNYG